MSTGPTTLAAVTVSTPVRIADVGGWTDTWFAGSGAVCHLAVGPAITVTATLSYGAAPERPVRLVAPDIGADHRCGPSPTTGWAEPRPGREPLVEHAIAVVCAQHPPPGPVEVTVRSAVPPGASLGTSASVVVAIIAALEHLLGPVGHDVDGHDAASPIYRRHVAELAHRVETGAAHRESGVQDQFAAGFGGAEHLRITEYPTTERVTITLDGEFANLLDSCTVTVILEPHDSAAVHREVISSLAKPGRDGDLRRATLRTLTGLAADAATALENSDLRRWAAILTEATEAQVRLHPGLVGRQHRELIADLRSAGSLGWKVNGAGGEGGSISAVFADPIEADAFVARLGRGGRPRSIHRLRIAPGLTVSAEVGQGR